MSIEYPHIKHYKTKILEVVDRALECHPRTFAVRVDLHLDTDPIFGYTNLMKSFMASVESQVTAYLDRKAKQWGQSRTNELRYCWVKEQWKSDVPHYHVILFFNRNVFWKLGDYESTNSLAYIIKNAWAVALYGRGANVFEYGRLAEIADKNGSPIYWLDKHGRYEERERFERYAVSYLCKNKSKNISRESRSFGYSYR